MQVLRAAGLCLFLALAVQPTPFASAQDVEAGEPWEGDVPADAPEDAEENTLTPFTFAPRTTAAPPTSAPPTVAPTDAPASTPETPETPAPTTPAPPTPTQALDEASSALAPAVWAVAALVSAAVLAL